VVSYEGHDDTAISHTSQPVVGCRETSDTCLHSSSTSTVPCCGDGSNDDTLRIAWRYKNLHLPVEFSDNFYHLQMWRDNAFSCICVSLSLCLFVML